MCCPGGCWQIKEVVAGLGCIKGKRVSKIHQTPRPFGSLLPPPPPALTIPATTARRRRRLKHYCFLRPAATHKSVKQALRFVQLLPRQYVDARTYNMLLRVCAQAGDQRNALHVADMLQVWPRLRYLLRPVGLPPRTGQPRASAPVQLFWESVAAAGQLEGYSAAWAAAPLAWAQPSAPHSASQPRRAT